METNDSRNRGGKRRFDSPEQEAFLNLWRTYDRLKAIEDELFARHGISAQQYNSLRLLRSVHPGSMPTLALGKRLVSRAPDMTRIMDRLEGRALIQRNRSTANRRVVDVAITAQGVALLDQMAREVQEMHQRQLGHLTRAQKRDFVQLLKLARRPHDDAPDWADG